MDQDIHDVPLVQEAPLAQDSLEALELHFGHPFHHALDILACLDSPAFPEVLALRGGQYSLVDLLVHPCHHTLKILYVPEDLFHNLFLLYL